MSEHQASFSSDAAASPPPRPPKRSDSREGDHEHHTADSQSVAFADSRSVLLERMLALHIDDAAKSESSTPRHPCEGKMSHCFLDTETGEERDGGVAEAAVPSIIDRDVMLRKVKSPDASIAVIPQVSCASPSAAAEQVVACAVAPSPKGKGKGCAGDGDVYSCDQQRDDLERMKEGASCEAGLGELGCTTYCSVQLGDIHSVGVASPKEVDEGSVDEESEDEDEDGFFHETVLFTNNDFQSLGSTRRTPSKTSQLSQEMAVGLFSPTPNKPHSVVVTPAKKTPSFREILAGDTSPGLPYQVEPCTVTPEKMRSFAANITTSTSFLEHLSPAVTGNTHTPIATPSSLHTPQGCDRLDTRISVPAAATTTATTAAATSPAVNEFFFIDNLDGTAYLADASLQLDGTYALGQTVLLAQSSLISGASLKSTAHRCAAGAESPVVMPQCASDLPQRRANAAHRPLRGAYLPEATQAHFMASVSSASPLPRPVQNIGGSSVSPSIARVVVRRSAAQSCDTSSFLPSDFSDSFVFNQTLLVPIDASTNGGCSAVIADASLMNNRSYRRAAPVRWDVNASPMSLTPAISSPLVSKALQAGEGRRARGVPRHSPSFPKDSRSVSRASPVPHTPIAAEQFAYHEARADRERRIARPDQDVIYLIPADDTTATMTSEEITNQGWIPVQFVDTLPSAALGAVNAADGDRFSRSYIGGGAESPLPRNPPTAPAAARFDAQGNRLDEFKREQGLSRRRHSGSDGEAPWIIDPASTLSTSTLECINRRLHFSMSGWASAQQRFGVASQPDADGASIANLAGSIVLPPATPLSVVDHPHQPHQDVGGGIQRDESSLHCGTEMAFSGSRSPAPLPPSSSKTPERARSPSRCLTDATLITPLQQGLLADAPVSEQKETGDSLNADLSTLLTSMSYQRHSTIETTTSEMYTNGGSLSIPLTSSASVSLGLGALQLGVGGHGSGSEALRVVGLQQQLQQVAQQLPLQHPRRVTSTRLSHRTTSSSVSMSVLGERSQRMLMGAEPRSLNTAASNSFRTTYCNYQPNATSIETASSDPSFSGRDGRTSNSVSAVGLPLSRGAVGPVAAGSRGERVQYYANHSHRYRQQRAGMIPVHGGGSLRANNNPAEAAVLSSSDTAPLGGGWCRNVGTHHHPRTSTQQGLVPRREGRRQVGAISGGGDGCRAALAAARLVPDTSVFLPWAPLTITPEGSLNVGGSEDADSCIATAPSTGAPMRLMPFTSSAEASAMTTTSLTMMTTNTSATDGASTLQSTQQVPSGLACNDSTDFPGMLRTMNTAVATEVLFSAGVHREPSTGTSLSRDALVSSYLQHAASQMPASAEDSLSAASVVTAIGNERSISVSHVSTALHDNSFAVCNINAAVAAEMESTGNEFGDSPDAASALTEAEPEAHPPNPTPAKRLVPSFVPVYPRDFDGQKENQAARFPGIEALTATDLAGGDALRSKLMGGAMPLVCREGSAANVAVTPATKERSPSQSTPARDTSVGQLRAR